MRLNRYLSQCGVASRRGAEQIVLEGRVSINGHIITELATQVAQDLQRRGYAGRTIGIKLRFDDFKTVTRDLTLPQAVSDASAIRHAAGLCLKRVDLSRRLRLLGVRAGSLVRL